MLRSTSSPQPPPPSLPMPIFLENNRRAWILAQLDFRGLADNFQIYLGGSFVLAFAETGGRIAQTSNDALLSEHDHGVEQRRSHGLTDHRHTSGVDQQPSLYASFFRHRA